MSYTECASPDERPALCPKSIETVIHPKTGDIGGFEVKRALPSAKRRMLGPFIFWDQMGPGHFAPGIGLDVRPHPHIGLSTVTYLFEGAMAHKDSLGNDLVIRPGEVNLMTAGKGIVHSERSDKLSRAEEADLFGIQSWLALPVAEAETDPAFYHYDSADIPSKQGDGYRLSLIMGEAYGLKSPVKTYWPTLYASVEVDAGGSFRVDASHSERAVFVVSGSARIESDSFNPTDLVVLNAGVEVVVQAGDTPLKLMLLGGEAMDGPRFIWWNFVSHDKDRIKAAAEAWQRGDFPTVPGDDQEFIPLPDITMLDRMKV